MARPKGTTRAKKPILRQEYEWLMFKAETDTSIQDTTKVKLKRAFTLLYLTGCRISEIVSLHVDDINYMLKNNEYSTNNLNKMKAPRLISFDTSFHQKKIIRDHLSTCSGYLFARNNDNKPMTVSALKLQMNNFIQRILGALYSTHSFRAGYITTAHQQGLSLEHIRQDIGHKDISTTARYATVTSDEISKAKSKRRW